MRIYIPFFTYLDLFYCYDGKMMCLVNVLMCKYRCADEKFTVIWDFVCILARKKIYTLNPGIS